MEPQHGDLAIWWRRRRLVTRCVVGLMLCFGCAVSAFIPTGRASNAIWLAAGAIVFLATTFRSARILIKSGQPALRLDDFRFASPILTEGRIDWTDVDDVTFVERRRRLYLDVLVSERALGQVKQNLWRSLGFANASTVVFDLATLKFEAEKLVVIFRERVRAARGSHFCGPLSPAETPATRAAKVQSHQPFFAYGLIVVLTGILFVEMLLRLRAGPDAWSIDTLTLYGLGATQRVAVVDRGEVWRLVTATLLHGGWLHLAGNAIALWFAARLIERLVGWRWFVAIFAISALAGAIVSVAVNPPLIVGVGASGGIVGPAAATAVLAFRFPAAIRVAMFVGGLRIVIPAMLPLLTSGNGPGQTVIDVAAHGGGAVAGALVAGLLLDAWTARADEPPFRRLALVITVAFFGAALVSLYPIIGSYGDAKAAAALDPSFPVAFKDAIAQAPALIRAYPRDPRVRAAHAETLVAKGDIAGAQAELRGALSDKAMLKPGVTTSFEPFLRVRLAQLLFDQKNKAEARATVQPICGLATGNLKPALARMQLCQ